MSGLKIFSVCFFVANFAVAAPRIACDAPVYDFGTLTNAESIACEFVIWNRGDSPLEITKVRACCGAEAAMESRQIAPGSNSVCRAVFILKNRTGEQNKVIYLASNDLNQPYTSLKIIGMCQRTAQGEPTLSAGKSGSPGSGVLRSGIKVVPERIDFLSGGTNRIQRQLILRSEEGVPLEIVSAELDGADGIVELKKISTDQWRVVLLFLPDGVKEGATLKVRTSSGSQPELRIPLFRIQKAS
jgi:hypothetical protein